MSLNSHSTRLVEKLTCVVMKHGKKTLARKIVHNSFSKIYQETNQTPDKIFLLAVANSAPSMILKSMRKGSQKVKIPFPITEEQRHNLGVRFIVQEAKKVKDTRPMEVKLAKEILDAAEGKGKAVARKLRLNQEIEQSRGNAYLRWS